MNKPVTNPTTLIETWQARINQQLFVHLPKSHTPPKRLHQAIHYMLQNGGKRIRPLLVYATGLSFGVPLELLDAPAIAVEYIHTYSLIHDDLPAMDNDDWRRGQPTCHKAYDEATAILAGDALQTLAYTILAEHNHSAITAEQRLQMMSTLARLSGPQGMVGGQALEFELTADCTVLDLETIHHKKTGALIQASLLLGALADAELTLAQMANITEYSACLGLAFQIQDDLLDQPETPMTQAANKAPCYVELVGKANAQLKVTQLFQQANNLLTSLAIQPIYLQTIMEYLQHRKA